MRSIEARLAKLETGNCGAAIVVCSKASETWPIRESEA
jgi:hypothetical protein